MVINRIKSLFILLFLPLLLVVVNGCKYQNKSDRPVRLIVSEQGLIFDGQELSFEQPLKEWIARLGSEFYQGRSNDGIGALYEGRFVYPDLGIDLEVEFNHSDPSSEWLEGFVLRDPYNRPISIVRLRLNPKIATHYIKEQHKAHFYNTMSANYAVDYFGAIIDSNTPKAPILQFGRKVRRDSNFNAVGFYERDKEVTSVLFFEVQPEIPRLLTVSPSKATRQQNQLKYFGVVVTQ